MNTSICAGKHFRSFGNILAGLIYPNHCFICSRHINWTQTRPVCAQCRQDIIVHTPPFCCKCGRTLTATGPMSLPNSKLCPGCSANKYYFEEGWTVSEFDGIIKRCIHLLKYRAKISMAAALGDLMACFYQDHLKTKGFNLIIPVPLSRTKHREREFNQAELLAKRVSRSAGLAIKTGALIKNKHAPSQIDLDRLQRLVNLKNAFSVKSKKEICNKQILLIDDVFTTGSTLNECARTLLDAGAKSVCVFALARGKFK